MLSQYVPKPSQQLWRENAEMYKSRWNFPNAIGAIDGKQVRLKCPKKADRCFFNYKQFFSVVRLAIVDANYKFVAIYVGAYGKNSDFDIFKNSAFGKNIHDNTFNIPSPTDVGDGKILPYYVILGDEAFALDFLFAKNCKN
ncbi:hypothetical protein NQ314_011351 [Rhamnusium bicolor]|uniref:DDE Tnp4 domain-containing protein n=1 Tax=Rhamnusium bicolor TaxID=1586634 RepID=A0AAV8XK00_9CUCU|nr:hypothetical protein NQ314_011351 [Rhamnusium bicolor]